MLLAGQQEGHQACENGVLKIEFKLMHLMVVTSEALGACVISLPRLVRVIHANCSRATIAKDSCR